MSKIRETKFSVPIGVHIIEHIYLWKNTCRYQKHRKCLKYVKNYGFIITLETNGVIAWELLSRF